MFKVIVERPRRKGLDYKDTPIKLTEDTILPKMSPMFQRSSRHFYGKQLNENLAPLKRFLASSVGRPWDEIWSEICEQLDDNNAVKKHVKDHAKQYVDKTVRVIDGVIYVYRPKIKHVTIPGTKGKYNNRSVSESVGGTTHGSGWIPFFDDYFNRRGEFYVDPNNGILKVFPQKPKRYIPRYVTEEENRKVKPDRILKWADGSRYELWDGVWFEFKTISWTTRVWKEKYPKDPVTGLSNYKAKPERWLVDEVRTKELMRQLGKKDLKRLRRWLETGMWTSSKGRHYHYNNRNT